jgi:hypothetical protein
VDAQGPQVTLRGTCRPDARITLWANEPVHNNACQAFVIACTIGHVVNVEKLAMGVLAQSVLEFL